MNTYSLFFLIDRIKLSGRINPVINIKRDAASAADSRYAEWV